jgi:hypothetical protein
MAKLEAIETWETAVYKDFNILLYDRTKFIKRQAYDSDYTENIKNQLIKLIASSTRSTETMYVNEFVALLKYRGLLDSIKEVEAMIKTMEEALRIYSKGNTNGNSKSNPKIDTI